MRACSAATAPPRTVGASALQVHTRDEQMKMVQHDHPSIPFTYCTVRTRRRCNDLGPRKQRLAPRASRRRRHAASRALAAAPLREGGRRAVPCPLYDTLEDLTDVLRSCAQVRRASLPSRAPCLALCPVRQRSILFCDDDADVASLLRAGGGDAAQAGGAQPPLLRAAALRVRPGRGCARTAAHQGQSKQIFLSHNEAALRRAGCVRRGWMSVAGSPLCVCTI